MMACGQKVAATPIPHQEEKVTCQDKFIFPFSDKIMENRSKILWDSLRTCICKNNNKSCPISYLCSKEVESNLDCLDALYTVCQTHLDVCLND